jgi:hypothetical protein
MLLGYPTLARNLTSILRHGLLCSKSQGKKKVVWACAPGSFELGRPCPFGKRAKLGNAAFSRVVGPRRCR